MTKGMGAPAFVVNMMRMMPGVWSNLMAVAHTLPYDATLMDGYMDGKPLPTKLWSTVTMPTLVLEGTESPVGLRNSAQALVNVLPNAQLRSKKKGSVILRNSMQKKFQRSLQHFLRISIDDQRRGALWRFSIYRCLVGVMNFESKEKRSEMGNRKGRISMQ